MIIIWVAEGRINLGLYFCVLVGFWFVKVRGFGLAGQETTHSEFFRCRGPVSSYLLL